METVATTDNKTEHKLSRLSAKLLVDFIVHGGTVNWLCSIQSSIDYIELNLQGELSIEGLAKRINTSSFYFQKIFSILCGCTVSEYIRNRRMTLAGFQVINTETRILDIALSYGYETNESFTRAFTRFHGVTPTDARKSRHNLVAFPKMNISSSISGGKVFMNDISERGYVVKETGAVYYTDNMDKTVEWFQRTLGWYGQIESRDEEGNGLYGCVNNIPLEIEVLHIAPFTGIHLFKGEPEKRMVGFMLVHGIDKLFEYVKKSGWNDVTEISRRPWGAQICTVTTLDGCQLTFFET